MLPDVSRTTQQEITTLETLWRARASQAWSAAKALDLAQTPLLGEGDDLYDWHWRAARWQHFVAMRATVESELATARRFYELAAHSAGEAVALQPTRVEGQFWRGTCLLEAARHRGKLAALGALAPTTAHLKSAIKLDESFHFAGPLRVKGRVMHLKPLLLGGNLDIAMALYTRALQLFPAHTTTLLYLGEAQWADHQPAEAKTSWRAVLSAPDDADWTWEGARDKKEAARLLAKTS